MEVSANVPKQRAFAFKLHRPSVDFIDNLDERFHPSFESSDHAIFDIDLNRYVPRPGALERTRVNAVATPGHIKVTTEMQRQAKSFEAAVEKYNEKLSKKTKSKLVIDPQKSTSWTELLEEVEKFKKEYALNKKKDALDYIRNGFRNFGKCEGSVNAWLELLPADAFEMAALVGGLRIIFGAARRLSDMREDTYAVLDQIPYTIYKAETLTSYYDSERLQDHVSQVYVAILQALEHILNFYKENPVVKFLAAAGMNDQYKAPMKASFERLKKLEGRIDEQGELEQQGRIDEIGKGIRGLQKSDIDIRNRLLRMLDDREVGQKIVYELQVQRQDREKKRQEREKKRSAMKEQQKRLEERKLQCALHVCDNLEYDDDIVLQDAEHVIRTGFQNRKTKNRAAYLLKSQEVGDWLQPDRSEILVINAQGKTRDPISSTSVFCAMLAHGMSRSNEMIVLSWFCGLHMVDGGVITMLQNLLGQLLISDHSTIDLSHHKPLWFERFRGISDPDVLLDLLEDFLTEQLQHGPVMILLDGASFFESRPFYQAMYNTIRRLSLLVGNEDGYAFKLLLTSPIKVMNLKIKPNPHTVLNMPPWVDGVTYASSHTELFKTAQIQTNGVISEATDDLDVRY